MKLRHFVFSGVYICNNLTWGIIYQAQVPLTRNKKITTQLILIVTLLLLYIKQDSSIRYVGY